MLLLNVERITGVRAARSDAVSARVAAFSIDTSAARSIIMASSLSAAF
jgi:hypothetical protein